MVLSGVLCNLKKSLRKKVCNLVLYNKTNKSCNNYAKGKNEKNVLKVLQAKWVMIVIVMLHYFHIHS